MSGLSFTEKQRATIAAAITLFCGILIAIAVIYMALLVIRFIGFFSGVFLPLAVAAILSTLLKPYYEWLVVRIRSKVLSVAIVFLSVLIPIAAVGWFFGALISAQVSGLMERIPVWVEQVRAYLQARMPLVLDIWHEHDLGPRLRALVQENSGAVASGLGVLGSGVLSVGAGVFRSVAGLLSWVVLPVYLFFMLTAPTVRASSVESLLPFFKEGTRKDVVYLGNEFVAILVAFFRGQIIVALAQGVLYAIGFAVVGVQYGVVLGMILGILNIVPYLGNILGLAVILPIAYFQADGGLGMVLGAGVVFVLTQMTEAYFLTPRIMGQRTGLHPMAILIAMFFWGTALGGIIGMVLAVPLTAFLVVLWRLLKTKYIREIV